MRYALQDDENRKSYYTGHRYQKDGDVFAVVSGNGGLPKTYSSKKIAENACKKVNQSVWNYQFIVVEYDE